MKTKIMRKSGLFILMFLLMSLLIPSTNSFASTVKKSGVYESCAGTKKTAQNLGADVYLKKVKVSGNKLTTYGSFRYYKSADAFYNGAIPLKTLKNSKRTFSLNGNTKYYLVTTGTKRISKNKALKLTKQLSGTYWCTIIVKNKKVKKITLTQPFAEG